MIDVAKMAPEWETDEIATDATPEQLRAMLGVATAMLVVVLDFAKMDPRREIAAGLERVEEGATRQEFMSMWGGHYSHVVETAAKKAMADMAKK